MNRRTILALPLGALACLPTFSAVRGDKATYVGGTISGVPDKTEGRLDVSGDTAAVFNSKKGSFSVPYANVISLEYGQKAGRRVGVALAVNPLFLFSKKRKHFVTIGFTDSDGKPQGVVLELAKGQVRSTLNVLETRTGKEVEFESEEAKKHAGN